LIVRPGLIVGPADPSDRFTYWPQRIARGGTVLAPAPRERFVQFIDVRDVAEFVVHALEDGIGGVFNVTGLPQRTSMGDVIDACCDVATANVETIWVDDEFLALHAVAPWTELPLWIPASAGLSGFANATVNRALAHGLTFRSLIATVADTLSWAGTRPADYVPKAGLSAEREASLLTAWRSMTRAR
jgi:2'-hydroxyisoflavone reductase